MSSEEKTRFLEREKPFVIEMVTSGKFNVQPSPEEHWSAETIRRELGSQLGISVDSGSVSTSSSSGRTDSPTRTQELGRLQEQSSSSSAARDTCTARQAKRSLSSGEPHAALSGQRHSELPDSSSSSRSPDAKKRAVSVHETAQHEESRGDERPALLRHFPVFLQAPVQGCATGELGDPQSWPCNFPPGFHWSPPGFFPGMFPFPSSHVPALPGLQRSPGINDPPPPGIRNAPASELATPISWSTALLRGAPGTEGVGIKEDGLEGRQEDTEGPKSFGPLARDRSCQSFFTSSAKEIQAK